MNALVALSGQTIGPATSTADDGGLSGELVLAVLGSSVLAAVLTAVLTAIFAGLSTAAEARRNGYADAIEALIAWAELPYRIRRRADDSPETLKGLTTHSHDLQERLARSRAWIGAESTDVLAAWDQAVSRVKSTAGPFIGEAWSSQPCGPQDMMLGDWGPGDVTPLVKELQEAVSRRFGLSRVMRAPRLPGRSNDPG